MPPAVEYIEPSGAASMTVSDELEHWLGGDQPKTLRQHRRAVRTTQLRAHLRAADGAAGTAARQPAVRAPRHRGRVRPTGVGAYAERVPRTAVLGPGHSALARRRRDRTRRPSARLGPRTSWCPARRD